MAKKRRPSYVMEETNIREELRQLKATVTQRQAEITQLNKSAKAKRLRLAEVEKSIADREVDAARELGHKARIASLQKQCTGLEMKVKEMDNRMTVVNKAVEVETNKLKDLQRSVEALEGKRDKLRAYNSMLENEEYQLHCQLRRLREEQWHLEQLPGAIPRRHSCHTRIHEQQQVLKHLRQCVEQCRQELASGRQITDMTTSEEFVPDVNEENRKASDKLNDADSDAHSSRSWCLQLPSLLPSNNSPRMQNLLAFVKRPWRSFMTPRGSTSSLP